MQLGHLRRVISSIGSNCQTCDIVAPKDWQYGSSGIYSVANVQGLCYIASFAIVLLVQTSSNSDASIKQLGRHVFRLSVEWPSMPYNITTPRCVIEITLFLIAWT